MSEMDKDIGPGLWHCGPIGYNSDFRIYLFLWPAFKNIFLRGPLKFVSAIFAYG